MTSGLLLDVWLGGVHQVGGGKVKYIPNSEMEIVDNETVK